MIGLLKDVWNAETPAYQYGFFSPRRLSPKWFRVGWCLWVGLLLMFSVSAALAQQDSFQAGGLEPPDSTYKPPASQQAGLSDTERKLDVSEKKDSGRGLQWLYVDMEGGGTYLGLETFRSNGLAYASNEKSSAWGPVFGGGLGVRLLFITIGARARLAVFQPWNIMTVGAEVGLHFPIGSLEPYVRLGGGYAMLGSLEKKNWGSDVKVHGGYARISAGLDYYLTTTFSIGPRLSGDILALSRKGIKSTASASLDPQTQQAAEADGSSVGASVDTTVVLGLHF